MYLQYRQMLVDKQWNYLVAATKEGSVRQITAADFLKLYKIGGTSASRKLAESLSEKELLNVEVSLEGINNATCLYFCNQSGSCSQPFGKPMAAGSTVGYFTNNALRSATKVLCGSMARSQ